MSTPKPGPSNHISKKEKTVQTKRYTRKPFEVDAIQVTEENFKDLAEWCNGTIVTSRSPKSGDELTVERYIKVGVARALNERQTKAYVGDWILSTIKGFKVYADGPFARNFALVDAPQELMATNEEA